MPLALRMGSLALASVVLLLASVPGTQALRNADDASNDPLAAFLNNAGTPPSNTGSNTNSDPLAAFVSSQGSPISNSRDPLVNDRSPNSPFGNPLINDDQSIPTQEDKKKAIDMENTLLLGEITEHIAEEREEEKIEEVCVVNNEREQTTYEAEQIAEQNSLNDVTADNPLMEDGKGAAHPAHHQCDPVWKTHRGILKTLFRQESNDTFKKFFQKYGNHDKIRLPNFPARIGEFVIEEVRHREKVEGQHVVLAFKGCSSCENDLTETMEWGGLTPVDELGAYDTDSKGKKLKDGHQIVEVRKSYSCQSYGGCSRDSDYKTWTSASSNTGDRARKFVTRASYLFSSYQGDTRIEPTLANGLTNPALTAEQKTTVFNALTNELHAEAKHVPFNHKLEQLRIKLHVCSEADAGGGKTKLQCGPSEEELVLHDGAIMSGSTTKTLLESLGEYEDCKVGPCGQGTTMTTCTAPCETPSASPLRRNNRDLCYAGKVTLSDANPPNWKDGKFSCIEEITTSGGLKEDTPIVHRLGASGLFFRTGTESKAHVTGAINWHVTVPKKNQCMPELGDALYVGLGVDEADACGEQGPDLDLGIVMYKCAADGLGAFHNCPIEDAITFKTGRMPSAWWSKQPTQQSKTGANRKSEVPLWGMYSGDNLSGEGEGDDEWFFMRLDRMKQLGVTHIAISAFVYGCEGNSRRRPEFSQLEGAFMRFVSGPVDQKQFPASETIAYYDLDVGMAKSSGKGALVATVFLEKESEHPLQIPDSEKLTRKDTASASGEHWQLAFLAESISAGSLFDGYREISNKLFKVEDIDDSKKVGMTDDLTKMGTGLKNQVPQIYPTLDDQVPLLYPTLDDLASTEINTIESTRAAGETNDEKKARKMSEHQFWRDFTVTVPGGHPGRALFCAA